MDHRARRHLAPFDSRQRLDESRDAAAGQRIQSHPTANAGKGIDLLSGWFGQGPLLSCCAGDSGPGE
jgi:hypothetical protein